MEPISFTATSAEEALEQIREKLGPEAVVLNVRPMPVNGLARLWQKPMIEVLAFKPEPEILPEEPVSNVLAEFQQQLNEIRKQVSSQRSEPQVFSTTPASVEASPFAEKVVLKNGSWRIGALLQGSGLLPLPTQRVLDALQSRHGDNPPELLAEEIKLTRAVLADFWRSPAPLTPNSLHILVGPAGTGKTNCLCKWLTQAVLMEGRLAKVWRLDGATANTAESLSVYGEILGMSCERVWHGKTENNGHLTQLSEDIGFIDLPGVDWRQPLAIKELAGLIKQFGTPHIHLVLNGAYDTSILLAQARAFSPIPIEDLIITHLDEETRWGKLWNLVMGTNYSIRQFSTGQNIPGDFCAASAEMILARQFPCK